MTSFGKLWEVLDSAQRRSAAGLLGLTLISGVLETVGVGVIIPVLVLTTQTDIGSRYPALVPWLNRLGNPSHERLVIGAMLALVGVYVVKAIFLAFLASRQARFVFELQVDLSEKLFAGYLRQPYTFHLERNSAQLILNVSQANELTKAIHQFLGFMAEAVALFGISAMLLAAEPVGAIMVATIFGLAGWSFTRFTRGHILRWGKEARQHNERRMQHLQQGFGAAKDVKLLGREAGFLDQFRMNNSGAAKASRHQTVLGTIPRLWLELLAVGSLTVLVFVMIAQGKPLDALLPTLGLFAAAAFRLMPSINRLIGFSQAVRFSLPIIDVVGRELRLVTPSVAPQSARPVQFKEVLNIHQIAFRYPTGEVDVLHDVSLAIPQGTSVGIIGGSGAGKSTLVDIILGLLAPDRGAVTVDGVDIQSNLRGWQDRIGYVPQSIFLTDDTIRRNVAFGLPEDQIDEIAVGRAIRAAQLANFIEGLSSGLDTFVGERGIRLSGGQRQRIGIARALYHDPSVLVLDEATSSLDLATERGVMEAISALQGELTIVIVAHRNSTIANCNTRYRVEHGRVVEVGPVEPMLHPNHV